MNRFTLIAPCHFGLEAVLKREIANLGYEILQVEDGRVTYEGDEEAVCRSNLFLRTTERVLVQIGRFRAYTFEEFFDKVKELPFEQYIPKDGKFWVTKASAIKSKLYSTSDLQRLAKKAMVERMKGYYGIEWFEETGAEYPIRLFNNKDTVTVALDTTGESLHKRGYRQMTAKAPISETLAAALIMLTPWNRERVLVDPFCGSGTFPIEAALMAANIAPGMNRSFTAESWTNIIEKRNWYRAVNEANDLIQTDIEPDIQGYDMDGNVVKAARANARMAGVEKLIHFQERPLSMMSHPKKYGFLITNPPYGERLEDKEALPALYREIGERFRALDKWSAFIITSYENAERDMQMKATKNRKIYNGMLKTYFYQFMGEKPPKRRNEADEN